MLRIPWLKDQDLPAGLSAKEDWQQWAKGFIDPEGVGFGLNDLVQHTAFSFFGENSAIAFRPKPQVGDPPRRERAGGQVSPL